MLYNPISGHGHLDSWLAMFMIILLKRGYVVRCFTPDTEALLLRLKQRGMERHPNATILPLPVLTFSSRNFKKYLINRLRALRNTYVNRLEGSRITPEMPFSLRFKKRLARLLVPPAYTFFSAIRRFVPFLTQSVVLTQSATDNEVGFFSPGDWGRQMKTVRSALPPGRYFLFNMYMDMYRTDKANWKEFARNCRLPWAGIRFVPSPTPREAYYDLPTLKGMCFLDEALCRAYSMVLPIKRFVCLPDVTSAALPDVTPPVAQVITERANGRKVVFMGGSIGGQKNIKQWRELIRRADPLRFFFAQIGEIHYNTCSQEERDILRNLAVTPPENFFMLEEYLADERDFNACIAAADAIFAVYKDFRISSNMPGKAAAFDKPIIVSDKYLMGEAVKHYGLGASIPEDDAAAILAALERVVETPQPQENFAAYRSNHNEEAMGQALEKFLDDCISE